MTHITHVEDLPPMLTYASKRCSDRTLTRVITTIVFLTFGNIIHYQYRAEPLLYGYPVVYGTFYDYTSGQLMGASPRSAESRSRNILQQHARRWLPLALEQGGNKPLKNRSLITGDN